MRYISMDKALPGMILARHIWGPHGQMFLSANTVLKESYIERLRDLKYSAVYVKSHPDEPVENIIEPVKQATLAEARDTLRTVAQAAATSQRIEMSRVIDVVESIIDQILHNQDVVFNMADVKSFDDYTFNHSVDVCVLSVLCAVELGMARRRLLDLGTGAILHDVGKLFVPKSVLEKPTRLTAEDWTIIRRHPWDGFQMLRKQVPLLPAHVALQHHERYDGTGYPRALDDSTMLDLAKITAVADSYSAMTTDRPYKAALQPDAALPLLAGEAGKAYSPRVLNAFLRVVAAYPLGSVVRLSDGSIATVVGATKGKYEVMNESGEHAGNTIIIIDDASSIKIDTRLE